MPFDLLLETTMLKIGDFSKICQVSVTALRHWDEAGLLNPAHTDPATGYRYYSIDQISEVNRVMALRTMGLDNKQIKRLLRDDLSASDIRAMLRLKQAQLEQELENVAASLMAVEARLDQIDDERPLPDYEVTLKSVPDQHVMAIRETVPTIPDLVDMLRETHAYARSSAGTNLLAVFHDSGHRVEAMDVEIGFPVASSQVAPIHLGTDRSMTPRHLPAVEHLACTVHTGQWINLFAGYSHLGRWIQGNGYQIAGPGREIFHHIGWGDDHQATVTELQFPVQRMAD